MEPDHTDVRTSTPAPITGLPRFAVVDIETSGLSLRRHRILQVAVVVVEGGAVVDEWAVLVEAADGRCSGSGHAGSTASTGTMLRRRTTPSTWCSPSCSHASTGRCSPLTTCGSTGRSSSGGPQDRDRPRLPTALLHLAAVAAPRPRSAALTSPRRRVRALRRARSTDRTMRSTMPDATAAILPHLLPPTASTAVEQRSPTTLVTGLVAGQQASCRAAPSRRHAPVVQQFGFRA